MVASDRFLMGATQIISFMERFGIQASNPRLTTQQNKKTGKLISVNEFTLKMNEKLLYLLEKDEG